MENSRSGPLQETLRRIRSMLFTPQLILIVVGIVVAYALIFLGELAGLKALGIHASGSTLAFILGYLIATFLCAVLYIAIVFTGAANYLTGALAERWTKNEFAVLRSAWRIFANVPFSVGFGERSYEVDVDHIVVGPYGVLVIETKFSSSPAASRSERNTWWVSPDETSNRGDSIGRPSNQRTAPTGMALEKQGLVVARHCQRGWLQLSRHSRLSSRPAASSST